MAFLETPRFPGCVSFGAVSGPRYSTVRTVVASGHDDVLIRYEQAVHKYTFEHANRTQFEHDELLKFFHAVKGMGHRFRVKDYSDYQVADGVLRSLHGGVTVGASGTGFGTATHVLQKKYTAGALTTYRDINKPIPTILVYRNGVLQTLTTHYAIDYTSGVVTFVADQAQTVASQTVGADHVFTLNSAFSPNVTVGQRVYVTDIIGNAAIVLNDLSHEVTNVSGADVTIATSTVGLNASGGLVELYPQDTLTWTGEFDVPVRFLSDEASWQIVDRAGSEGGLLYSWAGIDLTEVRIAL